MRLLSSLLLVLVLSQSAGALSASDDAQTWLQQARRCFERREWEGAQKAAVEALKINPGLPDAEILLGLIATARAEYQEAEKHFLRVLSLEPQNGPAQGYLASTYLQQKRFDDARRLFQKLLQLNPGDPAANYNSGLIAFTEGKPAEALPYFEKAHRANPSDIPNLMKLLESQLLLKRKPAAVLSLQKLKGLLESRDPRLFQIAAMLAEHGDYASAIPLMERFRQLFPQSYDVNYNLALAYFRSENYERAAEILQLLVDQAPRAEAYNLLAMAEEQRRRHLEAVRAFQRAAELEPGNEDYRFDYANELLQHRTNQEAIMIFASGVRDFPNSWKMRLGLGCAYFLVEKYEEAAQALLKALQIEPKVKLAYFFLGKVYEFAESYQAAIRQKFEAYLDQNPHDPWAYYYHANILYLRARVEPRPDFHTAQSDLYLALALNPAFAEAHLQLGIIAQDEGRLEESIPFLERAIQSNPKLGTPHYRLGLTYKRLGQRDKARLEFELSERLNSETQANRERQTVIQFLVQSGKQSRAQMTR